jgi:DNA-binding MurR/RpiR family transcriptional regulator
MYAVPPVGFPKWKAVSALSTSKPRKSSLARSLEARIYSVYSTLTPAGKRLATVLLEHQRDLASYTAGELAAKANVSQASAARLIRALGYTSYPDAKRRIRSDQYWGSPRAGLADPDQAPSGEISLEAMMRADMENIRITSESIPPALLDEISHVIESTSRLCIMGLRNGLGLAHHAAHYFTLTKQNVQVFQFSGATYAHELASLKRDDVLLVIAFRRRPKRLPTILDEARAVGVKTILITDLSAGASAKAADYVLRCRCYSPSPFNSFAAAVTLINYLAWSVATLMGEESLVRFQRIDRFVTLLDDVSTPHSDAVR